MNDRTPAGYRRTDPDETLGRHLARALADRDARMSLALARRIVLRALIPTKEREDHGV